MIELISSAVRDLAESNFIGERDIQNHPLPFDPAKIAQYRSEMQATNDSNEDDLDLLKPISIKRILGNPEREWAVRNILT